MLKNVFGLMLVGALVSATAAFAGPRTYTNKLITGVHILENSIEVEIEAGQLCAGRNGPVDVGCTSVSDAALLPEGPNQGAMLQLLTAAFANKTRMNVVVDFIRGTTTIISVSTGR